MPHVKRGILLSGGLLDTYLRSFSFYPPDSKPRLKVVLVIRGMEGYMVGIAGCRDYEETLLLGSEAREHETNLVELIMKQCIFERTTSGDRVTKIRLDVFNPALYPRNPGDKPKLKLIRKYIEGDYIVFVDRKIND